MNSKNVPQGRDMNQPFARFIEQLLGANTWLGKAVTDPIYGTATDPLAIPEQLLREVTRDYPGIWKTADTIRESKVAGGEKWPAHSFMPDIGWTETLVKLRPSLPAVVEAETYILRERSILAFAGPWRMTKKCYRFDPSLRKALMATSLKGDIPCETLKRLPEWAMYIETPGLTDGTGGTWDGFGVSCRYAHDGEADLQLLFIRREANHTLTIKAAHLALVDGCTLENAVMNSYRDSKAAAHRYNWPEPDVSKKAVAAHVRFISSCVSLVLWLCSEEPEVSGDWKPSKPTGKRVKGGIRHFPAELPKVWDVGVRIGAALDMAANQAASRETNEHQGGKHARPRGHVRRAHWHKYGTGHNRETYVVKWISPILVNLGKKNALPVTVCPVV